MNDVKHPEVYVQLTGRDGNAMSIIAAVARELGRAGFGHEKNQFVEEAMSGDYDNVLATAARWVGVG